MAPGEIKEELRKSALEAGFDLAGFASPEVDEKAKRALDRWINKNYHAGMEWMKTTAEARKNAHSLLPGVKTVIAVAVSYAGIKTTAEGSPPYGRIAKYARIKDYHYIMKKMMIRFAEKAMPVLKKAMSGKEPRIVFTYDTKPVMEKYFAWKAGLGFIGKNTLLITEEHGSYVFLGCILTNAHIEPDAPKEDGCGSCERCIKACPTGALSGRREYTVDARKCIAYWTIEHKGSFPDEALDLNFAGNLFGCDLCQEACPYNRQALRKSPNPALGNQRTAALVSLKKILKMNEEEFREYFKGTPVMRAGINGMKRNAAKLTEAMSQRKE